MGGNQYGAKVYIQCFVQLGGTSAANSCGTYTWAANGQFYTSSGLYQTSVPSSTGCDSIIGLNLTINTNTFATQVETACSLRFKRNK